MDVVAWRRGLGLERYAPAFRDNDGDDEVLPELTSGRSFFAQSHHNVGRRHSAPVSA
jgi:hypothetical protein